jgi:hypothetical protein
MALDISDVKVLHFKVKMRCRMLAKNPRINVTFDEATVGLLSHLAKSEHKSVAGLVRELALEALERREDMYLSRFADQMDVEGAKTIGHADAWK